MHSNTFFRAASLKRALLLSYTDACLMSGIAGTRVLPSRRQLHKYVPQARASGQQLLPGIREKKPSSPYLTEEFPQQDCQKLQLSAWLGLERGWPARGELLPKPALRQHSSALIDAAHLHSYCDVHLPSGIWFCRQVVTTAMMLQIFLRYCPKQSAETATTARNQRRVPRFRASQWALKWVRET